MKNQMITNLRERISKSSRSILDIEITTNSGRRWRIENPSIIGEVVLLAPVISGKTAQGVIEIDTDCIESIEYIEHKQS